MKPDKIAHVETSAARYVRLLEQLEHATDPMFTGGGDTKDDILGFSELCRDDFIDGFIDRDADGKVASVQHMAITVNGRLLLEKLRDQEALGTSAGIWRAHKWSVYGFILATLFGAIIGYLIKSAE